MKNIQIAATKGWLINSIIVKTILSIDVFVIKSILNDAEISFGNLSLLGDNGALVSFDSPEKRAVFLSMKDQFKEFFLDISAWDNLVVASK